MKYPDSLSNTLKDPRSLAAISKCDLFKPSEPYPDVKLVLIMTQSITKDKIYNNGLLQNILLFYRLVQIIGLDPLLICDSYINECDALEGYENINHMTIDDFLSNPKPVLTSLEIGMGLNSSVRNMLKSFGAKIIRLYLGNTVNIDTEIPLYFGGLTFDHHGAGNIDLILTSPHYVHNLDYTARINKVDISNAAICPYFWDPYLLKAGYNFKWTAPKEDDIQHILIFEPNISFQKSCILPLAIAEKYYNESGNKNIMVHLMNSDKFIGAESNKYIETNILSHLNIWKDNKLEICGRKSVSDILKQYPSASIICHQLTNEYNYMALECMYAGFPLYHNSEVWSEYGYYYKVIDIEGAAKKMIGTLRNHSTNLEKYKSHARVLSWMHSIDNPENQKKMWDIICN